MDIVDINFKTLSSLNVTDIWCFDDTNEIGVTLNDTVNITIDFDGYMFFIVAISTTIKIDTDMFPAEINPKLLTKTQLNQFNKLLSKILIYIEKSQAIFDTRNDCDYYDDDTINNIDLIETIQSNAEFKTLIDRIKLYLI